MLNLTEHVISRDTAETIEYLHSSPRQSEILRVLGHPIYLVVSLKNITVAMESPRVMTVGPMSSMIANNFQELGNHIEKDPWKVFYIASTHKHQFTKYIANLLPQVDMRYIDYIFHLYPAVRQEYLKHPIPSSSMNLFIQTPTVYVMADILKRIRANMRGYNVVCKSGMTYVTYQPKSRFYKYPSQHDLFDHFIHTHELTDDEIRELMEAAFATLEDFMEFIEDSDLRDRLIAL